MEGLHRTRELSLNDIADLVGNKTSGYSSRLFRELGIEARPFEVARLKGIHDHVRIYERKPFDGTDEYRAYLLGMSHGDFHVPRPFGDAVRVSTSSTHVAMWGLFQRLFSSFGDVTRYSRYKKEFETYEWNFGVTLDKSFEFLLESQEAAREWVSQIESRLFAYLAGIWDAEGSVEVCRNRDVISIRLPIHNTSVALLEFIVRELRRTGYSPRGLQPNKPEGAISSKWGIPRRKDYWRVVLLDLDQSQSLLRRIPLRHREKVEMKQLALSLRRGDYWRDVSPRVKLFGRLFGWRRASPFGTRRKTGRRNSRTESLLFLQSHCIVS
jgi:hypothetical protein